MIDSSALDAGEAPETERAARRPARSLASEFADEALVDLANAAALQRVGRSEPPTSAGATEQVPPGTPSAGNR